MTDHSSDHIRTEDPPAYEIEGIPVPSSRCHWSPREQTGHWHTACGHDFVFADGGPRQRSFIFCPFCGLELRVIDPKPTEAA